MHLVEIPAPVKRPWWHAVVCFLTPLPRPEVNAWSILLAYILGASCLFTIVVSMGEGAKVGLIPFYWDTPLEWLFDLAVHFRLQYCLVQLIALLACGIFLRSRILRERSAFGLFLLLYFCAGLNLLQILPYYFPSNSPARPSVQVGVATRPVKLLHLNLLKINRNVDGVRALVDETHPDLLVLQEWGDWWQKELIPKEYPYSVMFPKGEIALFSRFPIRRSQMEWVSALKPVNPNYGHITAVVEIENQLLTLLVAHPPLPPTFLNEEQNRFFEKWVRERPGYGRYAMIVGDLNTTPWASHFTNLVQKTDFRDSQLGLGVQSSWPSFFPPLGIPIDHALVTPLVAVVSRKMGPAIGSDHLPLLLEFKLVSPHE